MTPELTEYVILDTREDGKFDWGRYARNDEYLFGSNQGYENRSYALERAIRFNPNIPVFEIVNGEKVRLA